MYLSKKTLISIIRTGSPILVELIACRAMYIFFHLKRPYSEWLPFLLRSLAVLSQSSSFTFTYFFWCKYLSICSIVVSLHWKNLIMLLSQFQLIFLPTQKGIPLFITQPMTILALTRKLFVIIWELFHGRISLSLVLLLLVLKLWMGPG